MTTVGYGDYSGSTSAEYIFSVFLEFVGLTTFATIMGLVQNWASRFDVSFYHQLSDKMFSMNIWVQKINKSIDGNLFVSPEVYKTID